MADTKLFPDGHGEYSIKPANDSDALTIVQAKCVLCDHEFDNHFILTTRMRRKGVDPDLRMRYKEFEPMHYGITTCPKCLFSAETEEFPNVRKKRAQAVQDALEPYKGTKIKIGKERDIQSVFASYYLALVCAPAAIDEQCELAMAGLWLKLFRLYEDCGDERMREFAMKRAYDEYYHVYTKCRTNDKQSQQIAFLLGEFNYKMKNYDEARRFLHPLKKAFGASSLFIKTVEDRLEVIREEMQSRV
ncbi:MAG: DUF2225 domain-containing protein [Oscillospiraceae bacterium]|nr:DUF2225 domain-containing protein [Oscillospiraceae bacterium]